MKRIMRLASDARMHKGTVLVTKGSLWTPGLRDYLKTLPVRSVEVETLDEFGRILATETITL